MANYITHKALNVEHTFEIVEEIPVGYAVWNIGRNMEPGYLPLCRLSQYQPWPGACQIETHTLKAIQVEGAERILAAVGHGQETLEEMERYIKRYRNSKTGWVQRRVALYREAVPIMRKIKGIENLTR